MLPQHPAQCPHNNEPATQQAGHYLGPCQTASAAPGCCAAEMANKARKQQQECIYNWAGIAPAAPADAPAPAAPRVKTYNVSAPPEAAPRRMHEDSSQVGTCWRLRPLPSPPQPPLRAQLISHERTKLSQTQLRPQCKPSACNTVSCCGCLTPTVNHAAG